VAKAASAHAAGEHASTAPQGLLAPLGNQGTLEELLTYFPGMDIVQGNSLFGADQNIEPPDTNIAAGPTAVVETVNANMSMWSKTGTRLQAVDLNSFYNVPVNYAITDARVLYDPISRRFITSAVAIDVNPSDANVYSSLMLVGASASSDPTGTWYRYGLKQTSKILMDQPKIGTSDDKIAISWAEARAPGCDPNNPALFCFNGQFTWVLQKSDIIGGGPFHYYMTPADFARFGIVPAQALTPTTTQYMVYNNADPAYLVENRCAQPSPTPQYGNCPTLGEMAITGTPAANNIFISEVDPSMPDTTAPPNAPQLGSATLIQTGDDRLVSAVWSNARLWTSLTDGNQCGGAVHPTPAQEIASCIHLIQTATDLPGMPLLQNAVLGAVNDYWYYPAVSVDNAGDIFVGFSRSHSGLYPGAWYTGNRGTGWDPAVILKYGNGPYDSQTNCHGQNRFGDYSGAAMDPADPTDVWIAAEYALYYSSAVNPSCTWGTAVGRLTYSMPTITSVAPALGPGTGGTAVTIKGTDFVTSNTTVYFGSTQSSGMVGVLDPDTLTATSPPGSGWVRLSAATPEGHGPPGALFKYPRPEAAPATVGQEPGAVVASPTPPPVPQAAPGTRTVAPPPPAIRATGGVQASQPSAVAATPIPSMWPLIELMVRRLVGFLLFI
jgi:hypothetical protein